jgi:LEA14-like dessication related protein
MKKSSILILLAILSSCSKIQAPVYKSISDLKATQSGNNISIKGNVVFYNSNKTNLVLKSAQIDVFLSDQLISGINKKFDLQLMPEQNFTLPIDLVLDQDRVKNQLKNYTLQLLLGKKINLHCVGTIKFKAYHLPLKVRVNEEIPININDFF